jgi:hypothetical protein
MGLVAQPRKVFTKELLVKRNLLIAVIATAALALPLAAQDADALLAGCAIPGSADSLSASVSVKIYRIDGSLSKHEVRYLARSSEGHSDRLALAQAPERFVDSKFLSVAEGQYVYGRSTGTRPLGSSGAARDFLGSDLSFEDLAAPNPTASRNAIVGAETAAGLDCYIVESIGATGSSYAKALRWVAKDGGLLVKAELFNAKGKAVKSIAVTALEEVDGRACARSVEVRDLVHGSSTVLEFKDLRLGAALPAGIFSPDSLATASL